MSWAGPCSPAKTFLVTSAFSAGSPPAISSIGAACRPKSSRLGEPLLGAPARHLDHPGAAEGELVHAVVGRDDERVLAAEADQGLGDRLLEVPVRDAEELALGAGRVRQRAEEVEDRAHRELLADRHDVRRRLVVLGGEHEAEADLVDAGRDLVGRQLDRHPERLEHVGRARAAGRRAVAVLGDLAARGGRDQCRGGRDVEGRRPSPGPRRVHEAVRVDVRPRRRAHASSARARPARAPSRPWSCSAIRKAEIWTSLARPSMISASAAEVWSAVRCEPAQSSSIALVRMSFGISRAGLRHEGSSRA